MGNNKQKKKEGINRKERTQGLKRLRERRGLIGLIGGVGILGSALIYSTTKQKSSENYTYSYSISSSLKGLERYVENSFEIGNNDLPIMYILLQEHAVDFFDVDTVKKELRENISGVQLSIYRILEHLHKNRNLGLICDEGQLANERFDEDNPFALREKFPAEYDNFSDSELEEHLKNSYSDDGAFFAGINYPGLYI